MTVNPLNRSAGHLPDDYVERVYAGVLGKIIGVYAGRPFEGLTHDEVLKTLGTVNYYVNDRFGVPLVVADDDIGGTFTFLKALEDHGVSSTLSAEAIGKTWLNYLIEDRAILWWGGSGNSSEHTAWLNLKKGIPAPRSGSAAVNGVATAEQIGAQIFIDGWAMVSPRQPSLAARLARAAASVSHDGEAVHAAVLWAAMEAEAFGSNDINHLIDTGLARIPGDCLIARLITDIRGWHLAYADWHDTRQEIDDKYGYHRFPGSCHVVPNHAIMIMTVLYAPDDFHRAMAIVNTSGWDTDCNAGNVGCLLGLMHGLAAFDGGPDWRGPVADQMLISSADGGNSVNNAVQTAYYVADLGYGLAGKTPPPRPKGGAQFHFSLPGSVQGFKVQDPSAGRSQLTVSNVAFEETRALCVDFPRLRSGETEAVTTSTFTPLNAMNMRQYDLMASPLVYPGQRLKARIVSDAGNRGAMKVSLRARFYGDGPDLTDVDSATVVIAPNSEALLSFDLPDLNSQPIAEIGFVIVAADAPGSIKLDFMKWEGTPSFTLRRPDVKSDFWRQAWVNGAHVFSKNFAPSFRVSQDYGDGLIIYGTRDWVDYEVALRLTLHLGSYCGVTVRTQGLRRYYAVRLLFDQRVQIVRVHDDDCTVLAEHALNIALEVPVALTVSAIGSRISVRGKGISLSVEDRGPLAIASGGIGVLVHEGAASTDEIRIGPPDAMVPDALRSEEESTRP